ncbi:hypothetical protein C6P46_002756 [Rhodotorula mucilaginosa]|uniref:Uncharacterized protein n=1 Tax=Rhodotorula mucilaginosa TaxID=5537 RepID=A0A9P7B1M8_RHOMI|nr:hypothetical protein C6P46_002756 [Rhodotorula mucilaginosa]
MSERSFAPFVPRCATGPLPAPDYSKADPVIAVVLSHIAQKLARANSTDRKVVVNVAAEIADKLEPKSGERDPVYNFGWVEGQHRCARALALWRLGRHDEAKAEIYKIISILEQAPQNDWWYEEVRDRAKLLATNWDGALLDAVRLAVDAVLANPAPFHNSQLSPHSAQTLDLPLALTAPVRFERTPEMAKAKSQSADASAASTTKKRPAAASEIDDIFAKKPKATSTTLASGAATLGTTSTSKPPAKKVKKADKSPAASATAEEKAPAPSKRVPETVVDTSKAIEGYKPAPLEQKTLKEDATEEEKKAFEEEERFRDSRGLRQKTEDGLPIYSTSELKIGLGGGQFSDSLLSLPRKLTVSLFVTGF